MTNDPAHTASQLVALVSTATLLSAGHAAANTCLLQHLPSSLDGYGCVKSQGMHMTLSPLLTLSDLEQACADHTVHADNMMHLGCC